MAISFGMWLRILQPYSVDGLAALLNQVNFGAETDSNYENHLVSMSFPTVAHPEIQPGPEGEYYSGHSRGS
jgi:hypothetical protein